MLQFDELKPKKGCKKMKKARILSIIIAMAVSLFLAMTNLVGAESEGEWQIVASWEVNVRGEIVENGLRLVGADVIGETEGDWVLVELPEGTGTWAVQAGPKQGSKKMLYFDIDDSILYDVPQGTQIMLRIEYFDDQGSIRFRYNSWEGNLTWTGGGTDRPRTGSNTWKVHYSPVITNARFVNEAQRGKGGDFRVSCGGTGFPVALRNVAVLVLK